MVIKVHGAVLSTATMRVCACLNEKGLDYEFVPVDMRAGEHKRDPFLSLQPFGQVPALEDGDLKLFESRAINQYISYAYADKGTPLVPQNPKEVASVLVWMEVEAQRYDLPASKIAWELCYKPISGNPADEDVVEENLSLLCKVLDVYEARLAQSKYLAGNSFTLADLSHLPTLSYLMKTKVKAVFDSRPHVRAWCEDILERAAWKKVVDMKKQ